MALTKRQKEALDFIAGFIATNDYSPSFEEIAEGLGLASIATVHKHMTALESKGYLNRGFNQSRALDLTPKFHEEQQRHRESLPTPSLEMPLLGTIAAGQPIESYAQPESISFSQFTGASDVFALEVRGESMIEDHIMDGDYVLVEKTDNVRDGEIVVALVGGQESTLKRFYREGPDKIRLQPANESMAPIIIPAGDVQVQGRVMAVHRRYR